MCGIATKWKQAFYDEVEPIKLRDPLAVFLGAIDENEEFIFTYEDAVKLAGHSCPAVSGAKPRIARKLLENLGESEVVEIAGKIISLYEKKGKTPERLGIFIDKIGWEKFKEEITR